MVSIIIGKEYKASKVATRGEAHRRHHMTVFASCTHHSERNITYTHSDTEYRQFFFIFICALICCHSFYLNLRVSLLTTHYDYFFRIFYIYMMVALHSQPGLYWGVHLSIGRCFAQFVFFVVQ